MSAQAPGLAICASGTQQLLFTQDADGQSELSISYVVPQDGLLVATTKSSGNYDLTVYRNGERLFRAIGR